MNRNEIGVYIHIPFCKAKCYYCDFNSFAGKESLAPQYFDALKKEIALYENELKAHPIKSIFIGGGTPSSVDQMYIKDIMNLFRNTFSLVEGAEVSIETNPGTLDYEKLSEYGKAGINRLSIGLQAWQDHILRDIGRIHSSEDYENNLRLARKAGFDNVNTDLIFGLPGQTFEDWKETLKIVVGLGAEHISCYSLKIEEGTLFGEKLEKGEIEYMEDELDRDMYRFAVDFLRENGFRHYEISNFSKPGFECRHNIVYWKAEPYIGLGAGAHSYFKGKRYSNICSVEDYIKSMGDKEVRHENIETIGRKEEISEFMILGLRLTEGISFYEFKQRFGQKIDDLFAEQLDKLISEGLLEKSSDRLKLTVKGLDLANKVFVEFI